MLTPNELFKYNNVPTTPPTNPLGNILQTLMGNGSSSTNRFFTETAVQTIYVNPTTGSDTTGTGLTAGTAFASVQTALDNLPNGWTSEVWIQVAAGTFAGSQNWSLNVVPGARQSVSGTGRVMILGDMATPTLTLPAVAGVVVAGKLAQYTYNVGAYATVVTDGSHWLMQTASGTGFLLAAAAVRASASPNLVVVASAGTALNGGKLMPWATIFSGTVSVSSPIPALILTNVLYVGGIQFSTTVSSRNVSFRGCRFNTAPALNDCALVGSTFMAGTGSLSGTVSAMASVSTCLWAAGSLSLTGRILNAQFSVYAGAASAGAKVCGGGTSATVTTALEPAVVRTFVGNDYEGTGNAVRWIGGSMGSGGTQACCSVVVTGGYALAMYAGAVAYGGATWTWTGTGDTSSLLFDGSLLLTAGGFLATNSAAPGTDITVGALVVQATAVRPTTDPTQLCRYT